MEKIEETREKESAEGGLKHLRIPQFLAVSATDQG